jgi:RNA recognition motif-containing protein
MQIGYSPCLVPVVPISQLIRTPPPPPPPSIQYEYPSVEQNLQVIQSEPRKIIITQLPHSITEKELQSLLERVARKSKSRSAAQSDEYPIEHFEIVRFPDGKVKGHAFATFYSPAIARRAAEALNGKMYQRRELKVRLTKEGVESVRQASPTQEEQMYTVPPDASSEIAAQMGDMSMTVSTNATHSTSETKRERRDKGKSRTQEKGYNADNERGRTYRPRSSRHSSHHSGHHSTRTLTVVDIERERSSGAKSSNSSNSIRAPLVVDGSSRRRHR